MEKDSSQEELVKFKIEKQKAYVELNKGQLTYLGTEARVLGERDEMMI